jgi:hypothetical protein|tara:strand:- start:172 stop:771 length:600 start_codon:yes stop_codon:yes gene_type:complete
MKKLLYPLLAVSIIFTACKIEEEGCSDSTAINYNPGIEYYYDDGSCCYNILGRPWFATNVVVDSICTVSYMGETIDSLSNSGIQTINLVDYIDEDYYGPTYIRFLSDGIGIVDYNEDNIQDTVDYSINGNILMRKTSNHAEEGSFSYSINCKDLSLTGEEEMEWKEIVDFGSGPIEIDIHLLYSNTLNFLRIHEANSGN